MQISSRFSVALHILMCVDTFQNDYKVTSDFLAGSINTNPVLVRKLLSRLKGAGLVHIARGTGGVTLARALEDVTFYDVYCAVEAVEKEGLFHIHEHPNPACPVGRNIRALLVRRLETTQRAMESELRGVRLSDLRDDLHAAWDREQESEAMPWMKPNRPNG